MFASSSLKYFHKKGGRSAVYGARNDIRNTRCDDLSPFIASSWPNVYYPVATGYDLHIVLNNHDRVASGDEPLQLTLQAVNVQGMKTGSGFRRAHRASARAGRAAVSVASLTRWASPPESSVAGWPKRKYPRPTSCKTRSD